MNGKPYIIESNPALGDDEGALAVRRRSLETLRRSNIEALNFDPFKSSQFVEAIVCYFGGLVVTEHSHLVDGVRGDGLRVEVKFATAKADPRLMSRGSKRRRSLFRGLRGTSKEGKKAHVYVMVAYDDERLRFFVIPSSRLRQSRRDLEIFLKGMKGDASSKWLKYEVNITQLRTAIDRAGREQGGYEGLAQLSLF